MRFCHSAPRKLSQHRHNGAAWQHTESTMIENILVGYDGSESAKRCFRFALDLARAVGGRVHVVAVIQVAEGGPEASAMMMTDDCTRHESELHESLAAL